jgi:hypothetical protein
MDLNGKDLFGWELNNPDHNVFDLEIMEIWGGCRNCEQAPGCTIPCESVRRLVPRDGTIIGLGREVEEDKPRMSYFALLNRGEVKFILLSEPEHYWATASYIPPEQVPEWALSRWNQEKQGIPGEQ